ncbi:hypothetical protein [Paraclostridium bifermentans]|nr:hypothetical protein [Paraclostridium bifermentans]GIM33713.1 hypothetical protein PAGU1678_29820 [Paraclostridium bifermentans subsp. muricolitidis]
MDNIGKMTEAEVKSTKAIEIIGEILQSYLLKEGNKEIASVE